MIKDWHRERELWVIICIIYKTEDCENSHTKYTIICNNMTIDFHKMSG